MRHRTFAITFLLAALLTACQKPAEPVDARAASEQAIRDLEIEWSKAMAAKDAAKFTSYYAADASLYITGAPRMRGIEEIGRGIQSVMADPYFSNSFKTIRVHATKSGDLACSEGTYEGTATDPATKQKVAETGHYVTCFIKQADGKWKAITDITAALPPAAPPVTR